MAQDPSAAEAGSPPAGAWQPLTPQGVAAFAGAGYGRTLAMLMVFGLAIGMVAAWFVRSAWFPPVARAVTALPASGEIRGGRLKMELDQPVALAGNRFLSLVIDPHHRGEQSLPADVQLEFGVTNLHVRGVLGYLEIPYPPEVVLPFNQAEAVPWWGAWSQAMVALVWVGATLGLVVIWTCLALVYVPVARVLAWLRGARLSVGAAWRLCAAALMPGAVIMTVAIGGYGWGLMDLIRLGLVAIFHVMVAWVYVPLAVWCLPRQATSSASRGNPFTAKP
ncbi:hypothetical protein NXS98_11620 [Fontisphaera persica]|uniref:hypothetical protein n=1 Tax=Fontisphaera persica TaxID=2974023 RepID=UPI0024C05678|nr:hypothetical protein [Fontisphaera persica]WCJ58370.1 hypothetical protein NXS98_11620 [Fontisphaera persica]